MKMTDKKVSLMNMIMHRQSGEWNKTQCTQISNLFTPNRRDRSIWQEKCKMFCGVFSEDGSRYVTASEDKYISIFDATTSQYKLLRRVKADNVNWRIFDMNLSKDAKRLAYCSWSNCVQLLNIEEDSNSIQSIPLCTFTENTNIFSVDFSTENEIICGASDGNGYLFDPNNHVQIKKFAVNSEVIKAGFVGDSCNIIYTGTHNGFIKIWDKRCLNDRRPQPVGLFLGHLDYVAYIDSKKDCRHLLSNSMDQTIKLWDLRCFAPQNAVDIIKRVDFYHNWGTEWYLNQEMYQNDTSVATFRGHKNDKALVRAKFSPEYNTDQKFIYCGCSSGRLILYDIATESMVNAIKSHHDIIRDVAWHPYRQEVLTCSWDGRVNLNIYSEFLTAPKLRSKRTFDHGSAAPSSEPQPRRPRS